MNAKELAALKATGIRKELVAVLNHNLWEIGRTCDDAKKDDFADYTRQVARIRKLLDECDCLRNELESFPT